MSIVENRPTVTGAIVFCVCGNRGNFLFTTVTESDNPDQKIAKCDHGSFYLIHLFFLVCFSIRLNT